VLGLFGAPQRFGAQSIVIPLPLQVRTYVLVFYTQVVSLHFPAQLHPMTSTMKHFSHQSHFILTLMSQENTPDKTDASPQYSRTQQNKKVSFLAAEATSQKQKKYSFSLQW